MDAVAALTAALDGEYAAVYLYGVLGGRASRDGNRAEISRINASYTTHYTRQNQLIAFLTTLKAPVPGPAVAYTPTPAPVNEATRTACACSIETNLIPIYAQLIGATTGPQRAFGLTTLSSVSTAAVQLGQAPSDFPGLTGV